MKIHKRTAEDAGQSVQTYVLPADLTAHVLEGLFAYLNRAREETPIILDLKEVKEISRPELEILSHISEAFDHVTVLNSPVELPPLRDREDPAKSLSASDVSPAAFVAGRPAADSGPSIRLGPAKAQERLKGFFYLLADTLFHTAGYFKNRRGVYPGAVIRQFEFMAYRSFPIVTLITFLVGVTISLTSAAQLKLFGADLYLADFVGIAMFRELVPLMVGVILAGKIGAAITAEIASMTVLEEIDALKTMGIVPERFLMVPRLLAITLAMPLLIGLADVVGILGGILVARVATGIPPAVFLQEMFKVVFLSDFLIGLLKGLTFGWAVVLSSGFKGFNVKRSAEEVGRATTESVVLSISLIIVIDCIFALILYR
jgi:phospholipid/cholesterol/gamma-HCH transport system permease protein